MTDSMRGDGHLTPLEMEALSMGEWLGARETSAGQHLRICSACREELNGMKRENGLFREELAMRGMAQSGGYSKAIASWKLGAAARFGAVAALFALCVGVLWVVVGSGPRPPIVKGKEEPSRTISAPGPNEPGVIDPIGWNNAYFVF